MSENFHDLIFTPQGASRVFDDEWVSYFWIGHQRNLKQPSVEGGVNCELTLLFKSRKISPIVDGQKRSHLTCLLVEIWNISWNLLEIWDGSRRSSRAEMPSSHGLRWFDSASWNSKQQSSSAACQFHKFHFCFEFCVKYLYIHTYIYIIWLLELIETSGWYLKWVE